MTKGQTLSKRTTSVALGAMLLAALAVTPAFAQRRGQPQGPTPLEILESAPESEWIEIPEDRLVEMDLPSGPMVIELRPDLAPKHIEQIKTLTRQGFYDGVAFHRVIEGFVAQGGDPTGTGRGGSDLPDIPGEFATELNKVDNFAIIGRDTRAAQVGFVGTVPVGSQAPTLDKFLAEHKTALWGLHCEGVMSMARAGDPNSANSQFFIMFGDSRDQLDQGYTVWGHVVDGFRNARRINRGEPPPRPTPIVRMRMMEDIPEDKKTRVEYLDPSSDTFMTYLKTTRRITEDGFVDDICSIDVPVRINGELPQ